MGRARAAPLALAALLLCGPVSSKPLDYQSLWDFDQPAVSDQRFRAALDGAGAEDRLVLQTQIARTLGLRSRFAEAHGLLDEIEPQLAQVGPRPRVLYHLERGRAWRSSGDPSRARPQFEAALSLAAANDLEDLALDSIHMLALVDTGEAALQWNRRGIEAARKAKDPRARRWAVSMLNNLGHALRTMGRHDEALVVFEDNVREAQALNSPARATVAQWQVARTLRDLRRYDEALAIQRDLEAQGNPPDGFVLEEIAELLEALGRNDQARPYFAAGVRRIEPAFRA